MVATGPYSYPADTGGAQVLSRGSEPPSSVHMVAMIVFVRIRRLPHPLNCLGIPLLRGYNNIDLEMNENMINHMINNSFTTCRLNQLIKMHPTIQMHCSFNVNTYTPLDQSNACIHNCQKPEI